MHTPNVGIFAIGMVSTTVAIGVVATAIGSGTTRGAVDAPIEQRIIAPEVTNGSMR